jgi:hypothetical protein
MKPQEIQASGTHSTWSVLTVHRWDLGLSSVLQPSVGARPVVGASAHGRYASPLPVPKPSVGAPAHGRCSSAWPVPSAWSVLRRMVGARSIAGTQAHCPCSGLLSGLTAHGRYPDSKTADRRPAPRQTRPNKAVERTGKKLALFSRRSPLAFGFLISRRALADSSILLPCAPWSMLCPYARTVGTSGELWNQQPPLPHTALLIMRSGKWRAAKSKPQTSGASWQFQSKRRSYVQAV